MEDERTLLEKLARGDRASFDALYMRYAAKTEEFLCRMLKNRAEASLSITNSQSSLRLTSIESVMPSSHLILCRPLLLLPPIPPSIRVFSNESALRMRWP